MTVAFVGLGANLGTARRTLQQAFHELGRLPGTALVGTSSFYRSAPIGYPRQPDFINAVAKIKTHLSAERLLAELQAIEARYGRTRSFPNAPRTLDLDLLLFGNERSSNDTLTVPHQRMHERAFVLAPLVEIAPDAVIPGRGRASELLKDCSDQEIEKLP